MLSRSKLPRTAITCCALPGCSCATTAGPKTPSRKPCWPRQAKPQAFESRSQLKTWLVGILKHKVIDALRLQGREVSLSPQNEDAGADDLLDQALFAPDGHFVDPPADWGNPEQELGSRQFFAILEACTTKLPAAQGRLFLMREWLELSSEEICKELGLTPTNLYVQLHRARQRLRECLDLNWFSSPKAR